MQNSGSMYAPVALVYLESPYYRGKQRRRSSQACGGSGHRCPALFCASCDTCQRTNPKRKAEEKNISERLDIERDQIGRESREKKQRFELDVQPDEPQEEVHQPERVRQQPARELEDLEDERQSAEDAKLRLEGNTQALNAQYDRDVAGREELDEESKRPLLKQIREMEAELRDVRKQRTTAVKARSKLQGDLQGLEKEVEMTNKVKEEAAKQYKKLAAQMEDCQHVVEKARIALEEMAAAVKENGKRMKKLETKQEEIQDLLQVNANTGREHEETRMLLNHVRKEIGKEDDKLDKLVSNENANLG
ncbi:myosin heavy chain, embryonic smooth muscle isoform-like [Pomacea canaliculata]|uniref:myosin heavy chain, embryonic smooth muscle isoform-like n=1 Tax=Pomacea canaliculata TaxID=400727 RepID=UPI000D73B91C|nr:myosin heavy chain, embryonic smooth muscle isoform-like [Pomacea canaliculata]